MEMGKCEECLFATRFRFNKSEDKMYVAAMTAFLRCQGKKLSAMLQYTSDI